MGFKPKDRVRLKVRGVKIRSIGVIEKAKKIPQPKVITINKLRGLRIHLSSNVGALWKKPT
jgi:hypothetical protein